MWSAEWRRSPRCDVLAELYAFSFAPAMQLYEVAADGAPLYTP